MNSELYVRTPPLIKDTTDDRDWELDRPELLHPVTQRGCSIRAYSMPALLQKYGTCASYAAVQMCFSITRQMPGLNGIRIDPMDMYWRTRELMGTIPEDSGSTIRATMKALYSPGVIPWRKEELPSYEVRPGVYDKPRFRIPGYERVPVGEHATTYIKASIYHDKLPVMVGLRIPERHIEGDFGRLGNLMRVMDIIPDEPTYGHCMLIDGWSSDDSYEVLNSWGPDWGRNGGGVVHRSWFESPVSCMDMWKICLTPDKYTNGEHTS